MRGRATNIKFQRIFLTETNNWESPSVHERITKGRGLIGSSWLRKWNAAVNRHIPYYQWRTQEFLLRGGVKVKHFRYRPELA
jgi:hypothetical protein